MARLTKKTIGCFEYDLKDFNHIPGEFGTYDAFFYYHMAVRKLGKYEETNLEPEEITSGTTVTFDIGNDGFLSAIDTAFQQKFGITADDVPKLIVENAKLNKQFEDFRAARKIITDKLAQHSNLSDKEIIEYARQEVIEWCDRSITAERENLELFRTVKVLKKALKLACDDANKNRLFPQNYSPSDSETPFLKGTWQEYFIQQAQERGQEKEDE